jgi:hypothetical protein
LIWRFIDGDGTVRYSIGRPCRDHADEIPELAGSPASTASNAAADINISRRNGEIPGAIAVIISGAIYRSKAEIGRR